MAPNDLPSTATGESDPWQDDWGSIHSIPSEHTPHSGNSKHRYTPSLPSLSGAEEYELNEHSDLLQPESGRRNDGHRLKYRDGSTIDWWHEEFHERERWKEIRSREGLRGIFGPLVEASKIWIVVVLTGIGVGIAGGWLDVLVRWLGDLKEGRCTYGFFYNSVACCSGLDPGEVCSEWKSWSSYFGIRSILGESLLQSFIYIALSVAFASSAAVLVVTYAPYAFHTGIPEIKAILGGYVLDRFLSAWTLLIKAVGLALAVASGLSLGKEGPLVHVSCCMAFLLSHFFKQFRENEAQKRKLLAAAAAAGVSVAFGSPLGGVLFGLEELDTFANEGDVIWRGFVTSVIAAVALQYVDPFGTSKLVLFQVTSGSDTWRAFELIPWLFLAALGGMLGSLLIKLNVAAALYRRNSILHQMPILEVVGATAITAAVSYLVVFLRVQSSELVAQLFQECDPAKGDFHGLCNSTALLENIFLLILTAVVKIGFTAWTFGMMVPAGIFLPTIAIGASLGRAVGLITQGIQRAYPKAWIFSACPPDPTVRCVSPGFYSVIGASAMLSGVTRMTVSLVVILFELTGALSHVLPIMIAVMVAKWVADAFGEEGIYGIWIAMRRYPWLKPVEWKDKGEVGGDAMIGVERLMVMRSGEVRVGEVKDLVERWEYNGFPVVAGEAQKLVGFVARDKLAEFVEPVLTDTNSTNKRCTFTRTSSASPTEDIVDMSSLVEDVLQLRKEVPLELVVNMFRKLNLRHVMFTRAGKLEGMISKTDVVALSRADFPHAAALAPEPFDDGRAT